MGETGGVAACLAVESLEDVVVGVSLDEHLHDVHAALHRTAVDGQQDLQTRKEGNVLFNDALNTLYLWLYGIRHMVKDHSDSEKGNPLLPHRLLFPINSKGSFICTIPQTG